MSSTWRGTGVRFPAASTSTTLMRSTPGAWAEAAYDPHTHSAATASARSMRAWSPSCHADVNAALWSEHAEQGPDRGARRPDGKARRPRIPGVFAGSRNAASRDAPPASWSLISVLGPLMRAHDSARAADEDLVVADVRPERERLQIGARAERQLDVRERVAGDVGVHERDAGPVVRHEPRSPVVVAQDARLIRQRERGAPLHAHAVADVVARVDGAESGHARELRRIENRHDGVLLD